MNLILNNHIIDHNLQDILIRLRSESNNKYLHIIRKSGDNIAISCPFHKDGQESHASCFVYLRSDNDSVPFGYFKCFTCHEQGQLYKLVEKCLGCSEEHAKQWLIDNFSSTFNLESLNLTDIELNKRDENIYLDERVLDNYKYIHPYLLKRNVTPEIIKKFSVGWNEETDSITFPVWDIHNKLVGITERSVNTKNFYIPEGLDLPIYLLNYIIRENINEVYVVESQIDALTLWTFGYPAIALFGTGGRKSYDILKKSGIRIYHLCFDGDLAGRHGALRFIKNMPENVMIDVFYLPDGKDVNDLSKEEFDHLQHLDKYAFTEILKEYDNYKKR